MKLLANRKIKRIFGQISLAIILFICLSTVFLIFFPKKALVFVGFFSLCTGLFIFTVLFLYFREQNKMLEYAVSQIQEYIMGNRDARIFCDEEGELYRLFHEINSLASILNAHAEHERNAKQFMKNTILDISHQLKTPLAALNIYNGIIQEEAAQSSAIREFSALSEHELERIEQLVQNLLKIAKFDAGTAVLEKNMENISEILEDVKQQFFYRSKKEGKNLTFSGDLSTVLYCDRHWLAEAIGNIVKNALDHTQKGDTVHVEWRSFTSIVQIVVKDNGCGIHPEDLYHIFKRFYRSRFSQDTQGAGLGLPLAKSIIEAHHGTITVDSEAGSGTVFTIRFFIPTKM